MVRTVDDELVSASGKLQRTSRMCDTIEVDEIRSGLWLLCAGRMCGTVEVQERLRAKPYKRF